MSIVNNIFKPLLGGLDLEGLISPGTKRAGGLFNDGLSVNPTPEIMIGQGGLRNLEKAGIDVGATAEDLKMAEFLNNPTNADEFTKTDLYKKGVEIEPVSGKAMYEISDKDVALKKGKDLNKITGENGFLELFNAKLLEKAYPELENLRVRFIDNPDNPTSVGDFQPTLEGGILTINRASDHVKQNGIRDTVIHEVQHYAQLKEDFTAGESFRTRLDEEPSYTQGKQEMVKLMDSGELTQDLLKFSQESQSFPAKKMMTAINDLMAAPQGDPKSILKKVFGDDAKVDAFIERSKNYPTLDKFMQARDMSVRGYLNAFNKYQRVSGEAWARNAADRMNKTKEELLQQPAREAMNTNKENIEAGVNYNNLLDSRIQQQMPEQFSSISYSNPLEPTI